MKCQNRQFTKFISLLKFPGLQYTHTCNPPFYLHDSHKKAFFLLVFTICIVRLGDWLEERSSWREGETTFVYILLTSAWEIEQRAGMGRIHKVSRQIACGANRLARFSSRIHFVRWSSTSKVWRTFVEGKKGNYALPSLLGLPWVLYKDGFM